MAVRITARDSNPDELPWRDPFTLLLGPVHLAPMLMTSDFAGLQLWSSYARKQFEMLSNQSKVLTVLSQSLASEAVQPMKRAANQFTSGS